MKLYYKFYLIGVIDMSTKKISYQIRDPRWNEIFPEAKTQIRELMKDYVLPTIYSDYDKVVVSYFLKIQSNDLIEYLVYEKIEDFLYAMKVLLKKNKYNYDRYGKKLYKRLKLLVSISKTNHMMFTRELYDDKYSAIPPKTKK
jgi:hypothetical protein